jgi:hypothetical protein
VKKENKIISPDFKEFGKCFFYLKKMWKIRFKVIYEGRFAIQWGGGRKGENRSTQLTFHPIPSKFLPLIQQCGI